MPDSRQALPQVILPKNILLSLVCCRGFDASWISRSFLWNYKFPWIDSLALGWARLVKPHCLANSNYSLLSSRLSCSITTWFSLSVSFSSHCSRMSFVKLAWRLSVVSGTLESFPPSLSSHSFCSGSFDFLPPFLAEFVLELFAG